MHPLIFAAVLCLMAAAHLPDGGRMVGQRAFRPLWVLVGDSITQYSFNPEGWGTLLASQYGRRVDIVNRGFGGYNSVWGLKLLPYALQGLGQAPQLATVFFGANDAALPDRTSCVGLGWEEEGAAARA